MTLLSTRAKNCKQSPTLSISATAKALKEQGKEVIDFSAGQPDFEPPSFIKKAVKQAIDEPGIGRYNNVSGSKQCREAIAEKIKSDYNIDYEVDEIIVTNGAKQALFNVFQAMVSKDDEVIIPEPYWASFPDMVSFTGATPIIVKTDDNFKLAAEDVEGAITKKTKLIILNSPCNPTGTVFDEKELQKIAELAVENNIFIVADDTYDKIIFGKKHFCIPSISEAVKKQTIYVNTLSKTYAMPGLRIGYAAAPKKIIAAMSSIQGLSTSNVNAVMQAVAVQALKAPEKEVQSMAAEFRKRRDFIVKALNSISGIECAKPEGAFYVFPKIPSKNSLKWSEDLLKKKLVAVVPGSAFGREDHVRISYAASMKDIEEGIKRIREFV